MWKVAASNKLIMSEGDYNISLPITITGATLTSNDNIKLIIRDSSGTPQFTKDNLDHQTDPNDYNKRYLTLNAEQSANLTYGDYTYSLIWYQNNTMQCTLIDDAEFLVR